MQIKQTKEHQQQAMISKSTTNFSLNNNIDTQQMSPLLFDTETDDEEHASYNLYPNQDQARLATAAAPPHPKNNEHIFQIFASLNAISNRLERSIKTTPNAVKHRRFSAPLLCYTPTTDYSIDDNTPIKEPDNNHVKEKPIQGSRLKRGHPIKKSKLCKLDVNVISSMPKQLTKNKSTTPPPPSEQIFPDAQQYTLMNEEEINKQLTAAEDDSVSLLNTAVIEKYHKYDLLNPECLSFDNSTPDVQIISQAAQSIVTISSGSTISDCKTTVKVEKDFTQHMLLMSPDLFGDFHKLSDSDETQDLPNLTISRPNFFFDDTSTPTNAAALHNDERSRDLFSDSSISSPPLIMDNTVINRLPFADADKSDYFEITSNDAFSSEIRVTKENEITIGSSERSSKKSEDIVIISSSNSDGENLECIPSSQEITPKRKLSFSPTLRSSKAKSSDNCKWFQKRKHITPNRSRRLDLSFEKLKKPRRIDKEVDGIATIICLSSDDDD